MRKGTNNEKNPSSHFENTLLLWSVNKLIPSRKKFSKNLGMIDKILFLIQIHILFSYLIIPIASHLSLAGRKTKENFLSYAFDSFNFKVHTLKKPTQPNNLHGLQPNKTKLSWLAKPTILQTRQHIAHLFFQSESTALLLVSDKLCF